MKMILLEIALAPLVLAAGGCLYQRLANALDRRRMLSPGRLVRLGDGRRAYLLEKGAGSPSVVFESGFAASSLNWLHLQSRVAQHAHTVAYDRLGLGWSDDAVTPRTPKVIASELRALLYEAGIPPPYLLVGHSFGGLVMRRYALDYPDETLGVVLVDPMRTEEWPPMNEPGGIVVEKTHRLARYGRLFAHCGMARLAVRSLLCRSGGIAAGLARLSGEPGLNLLTRLLHEVDKMPASVRPAIAAHWGSPCFYSGLIAHLEGVAPSVIEMHDAEPIRDAPVRVLTPASATPLSEHELRKIGVHTRQTIAHHSRHWVHLDEPELVVAAILELAEKRSHAPVGCEPIVGRRHGTCASPGEALAVGVVA